MSKYDLTFHEYNELYEHYLKKSPFDLFKTAGITNLQDKSVLDLCSGTLRLAEAAHFMGAKEVCALDESKSALPPTYTYLSEFYHTSVERFLRSLIFRFVIRKKFDVVICQQAVNYWFSEKNIKLLAKRVMAKQGIFIFNTFNSRPSEDPVLIKRSPLSWECYYCGGDNMVHHWQIKKPLDPHETSFQWIHPTTFNTVLNKYFTKVDKITQDKADVYVCRR